MLRRFHNIKGKLHVLFLFPYLFILLQPSCFSINMCGLKKPQKATSVCFFLFFLMELLVDCITLETLPNFFLNYSGAVNETELKQLLGSWLHTLWCVWYATYWWKKNTFPITLCTDYVFTTFFPLGWGILKVFQMLEFKNRWSCLPLSRALVS